MRFQLRSLLATLAFVFAISPASKAVDIFNTLSLTGGTSVLGNNMLSSVGFQTTAAEYLLTNVNIMIGNYSNTGNLTVSVWTATGSNNRPGTKIVDIATTAMSAFPVGTTSTYAIAGLNQLLSPSTQYYLVMGANNATMNAITSNGVGGLTTGSLGLNVSFDNGATWPVSQSTNYLSLQISATVPEPSTYALSAIATGVMAAVARRRTALKA